MQEKSNRHDRVAHSQFRSHRPEEYAKGVEKAVGNEAGDKGRERNDPGARGVESGRRRSSACGQGAGNQRFSRIRARNHIANKNVKTVLERFVLERFDQSPSTTSQQVRRSITDDTTLTKLTYDASS